MLLRKNIVNTTVSSGLNKYLIRKKVNINYYYFKYKKTIVNVAFIDKPAFIQIKFKA